MTAQEAAGAAGEQGAAFGTDQWLEFIARLHPVVLHVPIGLFVAALLLELMTLFSRGAVPARRGVYVLLALSSAAAAWTGWLLGIDGEYRGEMYEDHRMFGIAAGVVGILVALLDLIGRSGTAAFARRVLVLLGAAIIGLAGHHGGMITHGRTFLSSKAPPWLAPYLTEEKPDRRKTPKVTPAADTPTTDVTAAVDVPAEDDPASPDSVGTGTATEGPAEGPAQDSQDDPAEDLAEDGVAAAGAASAAGPGANVAPTGNETAHAQSDIAVVVAAFRERCFECHDVDKTKGDLRLDVLEGWTSQVDLESPEDSEMIYRIILPADDADAMPPKGDRMSPEVIEALQRWIEDGASTEELGELLGVAQADEDQASADLDEIRRATGARIEPIALDLGARISDQRFDVTWRHADEGPDAESAQALAPIADRVVELDLARPDVTDDVLRRLPTLPALERVHLERSAVTDAGVVELVRLAPAVRYVNLHSTAVGDAAVAALDGLDQLERVVLFSTEVSESVVDGFVKARAEVKVTRDAGFPDTTPFIGAQPRRILEGNAGKRRVALLREIAIGRPEVLWERPVEAVFDLQWLGDTADGHGRVLVQETAARIVEVETGTNEVLWSYDATSEGDDVAIRSFRRLESGETVVLDAGRRRLVLVDAAGAVTSTIPLLFGAGSELGLVRPTPSGALLVAHGDEGRVVEYGRDAESPPRSLAIPAAEGTAPHALAAVRLEGGDTLVSTGPNGSVLRLGPDGAVRWRLTSAELDGVEISRATTVQELSSGHVVLGNRGAGAEQPQAVEIRPDGRIEWRLQDFERFGDDVAALVIVERSR